MFIQRGSAILRAPEPDPAAGTGGGGEALTEVQQAAIGKIVNSAITSHLGRIDFGAKVAEGLKTVKWSEVLAEPMKALLEQTPGSGTGGGGDDDPSKAGGKAGKVSKDPAVEQQLKSLAEKLEASEKKAAAADQARAEAEQKRLLDGATTSFRNGLQSKLRPELLDVAVGHFGVGLKVDEKGNALYRVKKAPYKGAPEEDMDLPLVEALPILLANESMKPFLPAPGGDALRKGGNPGGGPGATPADPKNPLDRVAARLASMGIDFNNEFQG